MSNDDKADKVDYYQIETKIYCARGTAPQHVKRKSLNVTVPVEGLEQYKTKAKSEAGTCKCGAQILVSFTWRGP